MQWLGLSIGSWRVIIVSSRRFGDPFVINVFRDVTLTQLIAAFLYEMSELLKDEAIERVNLVILSFIKHVKFLQLLSLSLQYLHCNLVITLLVRTLFRL